MFRPAWPLMPALATLSVCLGQQPMRPAHWLDPDRSEPAGTHYRTFSSALAKSEVSYQLYLPPDYETAPPRRYPVVYWLHGAGGDQRSGIPFVRSLDAAIRAGRAPAMIAVLVNGMRNSFYCDSAGGARPVESVIVKELIPHIDGTLRTLARRETRCVEGYSMGGFGAAHLGFKYPDLFGIVCVNAGAMVRAGGPGRTTGRPEMLALVQANDVFDTLRRNAAAIRGRTTVRVAVGAEDALRPRNQLLDELLTELHIEHEYEVVPGVGHSAPRFYEALGERAFAHYRRALAAWGAAAEGR